MLLQHLSGALWRLLNKWMNMTGVWCSYSEQENENEEGYFYITPSSTEVR